MRDFATYGEAADFVLGAGEGAVASYWGGARETSYEEQLLWLGFDHSKEVGLHDEYVAEMKKRGLA